MEFGIKKCNVLILKSDIKDENFDIMLPNDLKILLKEGENYKYLRILETDDINTKKMKEKSKLNTVGAPERFLSQNLIVKVSTKL